MKRLLLFVAMLIIGIAQVNAQEQGILFQNDPVWKDVVKRAKKAKKLIFVDCYTSWCGPCKMLSTNVFTQKEVGDVFNAKFINIKIDCEKGEGGMLKNKFEVQAYPTMVFYNPLIDQVEHRLVGYVTPEILLSNAEIASDPNKNLRAITEKYNNGTLKPEELGYFLELLQSAYMQDKQAEVAEKYLDNLSAEQLATKDNWLLIAKNVNNPLSPSMKKVVANIDLFYANIGRQPVDTKVNYLLKSAVARFSMWTPKHGDFDWAALNQLKDYLYSIDLPIIPELLGQLFIAEAYAKADYAKMFEEMELFNRYHFFNKTAEQSYVIELLRKLSEIKDVTVINQGISKLNNLISATTDDFMKATLFETKAKLQSASGDEINAEQSKIEAKKYDELGKQKSGGKVMRAFQMQ